MSAPVNATFKKMNYAGQPEIFVLHAPESFGPTLAEMRELTEIHTEVAEGQPQFLLAFCTKQTEVDAFAQLCATATVGDAVIWVAYPKGTSKRYRCEFNRDNGWAAFGTAGFEPVRQVAIDEDWSALRFRRVGFIKTMKRGGAISDEGQKRIAKKNPTTAGGA